MSETIHIGDLVCDTHKIGWVISDVDSFGFYLLEWCDGWRTRAVTSVVVDYKYEADWLTRVLTGKQK